MGVGGRVTVFFPRSHFNSRGLEVSHKKYDGGREIMTGSHYSLKKKRIPGVVFLWVTLLCYTGSETLESQARVHRSALC